MKKMSTAQLREAFLSFYESKGHFREKAGPLIPQSDPTLMFTSAGMVPFKNVFTGLETRSYTRATTVQPCIRAGGKHNDLENVGFTKRHQTFFEMLGNFSFGDYFKVQAITWAWEFATEVLLMPKEKLYITIHKDDEESFEIWNKKIGIEKERIFRFDKDNFWAAGEKGPCGPCSELFFDRGEAYNTGNPRKDCVGGEGERYVEFHNLVFMQFNRDENGEKKPLPRPSVDTGMGLERTASILQGVDSNYETDLFSSIISSIEEKSGKKYGIGSKDKHSVAMRVIADHLRSISFLVAEGLVPSNEGAAYVLRRILRRAVRFGKNLGFTKAFLYELVCSVVEEMGKAYPLIAKKQKIVEKVIKGEEERFFQTLEKGLQLLQEELNKLKPGGKLDGTAAFLLYDTFGFPLDLTQMIAREKNYSVDDVGFNKEMEKQKTRSKSIKRADGDIKNTKADYEKFASLSVNFTGYHSLEDKGKLLVLLSEGKEVQELKAISKRIGFQGIFDTSPFYGESGGQIGDIGKIMSLENRKTIAEVNDVQKIANRVPLICGEVLEGQSLMVGKSYGQAIPKEFRAEVASNHTATHLLHWALRTLLGEHVRQAGSLVKDGLLRLDFTHNQPLSMGEIEKLEDMVNKKIALSTELSIKLVEKEEALQSGAIAFFGEKYEDKVRVLDIGGYSIELCGGTHVNNTSEIRLFKIISEQGIAAGVRRIIAYTGQKALLYLRESLDTIQQMQSFLNVKTEAELVDRVKSLQQANREMRKQLEVMEEESFHAIARDIKSTVRDINGISFITKEIKGNMQQLRRLSNILRQHLPQVVIVLGAGEGSKANLFASVPQDLFSKIDANFIIQKLAPFIDGKGGGKKEAAQAGGGKVGGVAQALSQVEKVILSYPS